MDLKLTGKVVAITGGSEGIGYAMAEAFAKEGCQVAICSRSQAKLDKARAEFKEKGFDLYVRSVDVSDSDRLYGFVDEVKKDFGRIDIWINNTATTVVKSILELELEEWNQIMRTNLNSYFVGTQAAGRVMKEQGGGVIINVASFGGLMPPMYRSAYCTSKYGINGLTRMSAAEFAPFGIRVNAVAPGTINTAMQAAAGRSEEDVKRVAKNFALHRAGGGCQRGFVPGIPYVVLYRWSGAGVQRRKIPGTRLRYRMAAETIRKGDKSNVGNFGAYFGNCFSDYLCV